LSHWRFSLIVSLFERTATRSTRQGLRAAHRYCEYEIIDEMSSTLLPPSLVMRGHSRSKNGVASLAYDPRIHAEARQRGPNRNAEASGAAEWIAGSSPAMTK
jgi:hypothetical protein